MNKALISERNWERLAATLISFKTRLISTEKMNSFQVSPTISEVFTALSYDLAEAANHS
ncbi:hypothetical protein [Modicisalibacter luteus]|uniref:Uncharacterized protein n=1 Tax=Modicisalibacter luteus TaxID=453962 RepID=A0ABV7M530_9GAMM|nr:hypothetical protein [Halomonas lutea]